MLEIIFQLIAAFVGTVSFSILFSTPNKYLPQCGLVGALGWGVHLLTLDVTGLFRGRHFCRKCDSYNLLKISGRIYKVTTTLFLISGIFTLVPGAGIYYTAYYTITGPGEAALYYGMSSLKTAIAIGLGIGMAYSLPPKLFGGSGEAEIFL